MLRNIKGMTLIEVLATLAITLLIMAALFSFSIAMQKSGLTTRKAAYSGQAIEMALTQLRNELAGATNLVQEGEKLSYIRVRDGENWIIELEDTTLQRRLNKESGTVITLAKGIDHFKFALPSGVERSVQVTVQAGDFALSDAVYLRNRSSEAGEEDPNDEPGPGGGEAAERLEYSPFETTVQGEGSGGEKNSSFVTIWDERDFTQPVNEIVLTLRHVATPNKHVNSWNANWDIKLQIGTESGAESHLIHASASNTGGNEHNYVYIIHLPNAFTGPIELQITGNINVNCQNQNAHFSLMFDNIVISGR